MKKIYKKYLFIIIIFFAIIRFILTNHLTIVQRSDLTVDDAWVVFTAYNLKHGFWLGKFSINTLIKGMTAPLLLAFSSSVGLSYINFVTLLYIISCTLFLYSIKEILKNKIVLILLYICLLFNPIMYGEDIVQRVYRNSFVPSFSLIIISIYIILLNKSNMKNLDMIFMSIIAGIVISLFFNLREDAIWIVPYLIFMFISITLIRWKRKKKIWASMVILLIPLGILTLYNLCICFINYEYYGIFERIDFDFYTDYTKTYQLIKKIDYDNLKDIVRVSKKKMERLCEVSPTLNKNRDNILYWMEYFGNIDCIPEDGEVDNALFMWALRAALENTEDSATARKIKNIL